MVVVTHIFIIVLVRLIARLTDQLGIITVDDLFKNGDFNEISPLAHKYKSVHTHTHVNEHVL